MCTNPHLLQKLCFHFEINIEKTLPKFTQILWQLCLNFATTLPKPLHNFTQTSTILRTSVELRPNFASVSNKVGRDSKLKSPHFSNYLYFLLKLPSTNSSTLSVHLEYPCLYVVRAKQTSVIYLYIYSLNFAMLYSTQNGLNLLHFQGTLCTCTQCVHLLSNASLCNFTQIMFQLRSKFTQRMGQLWLKFVAQFQSKYATTSRKRCNNFIWIHSNFARSLQQLRLQLVATLLKVCKVRTWDGIHIR